MQQTEIEIHSARLVKLCNKAPSTERQKMRPVVDRVIRTLKSHHQPVPGTLSQLKAALEDEALDDMFDNMPV